MRFRTTSTDCITRRCIRHVVVASCSSKTNCRKLFNFLKLTVELLKPGPWIVFVSRNDKMEMKILRYLESINFSFYEHPRDECSRMRLQHIPSYFRIVVLMLCISAYSYIYNVLTVCDAFTYIVRAFPSIFCSKVPLESIVTAS